MPHVEPLYHLAGGFKHPTTMYAARDEMRYELSRAVEMQYYKGSMPSWITANHKLMPEKEFEKESILNFGDIFLAAGYMSRMLKRHQIWRQTAALVGTGMGNLCKWFLIQLVVNLQNIINNACVTAWHSSSVIGNSVTFLQWHTLW